MSDTPRTDAIVAELVENTFPTPETIIHLAGELERENAALQIELAMWRDGNIIREEDRNEVIQLRADAERVNSLDDMMNYRFEKGGGMTWSFFSPVDTEDVRTAIDAARKEQP